MAWMLKLFLLTVLLGGGLLAGRWLLGRAKRRRRGSRWVNAD